MLDERDDHCQLQHRTGHLLAKVSIGENAKQHPPQNIRNKDLALSKQAGYLH